MAGDRGGRKVRIRVRALPTAIDAKQSGWIRPWNVAIGYAVVAGLWILTSGLALDATIGRDGELRSVLEQVKGFAFVGITALVLWVVIRRFAGSLERLRAQSARLAQFPQLSPNPVVELAADGSIASLNMAASIAVREASAEVEELLPREYATIARDCIASGEARPQITVNRSNRTWEWTIFPVTHPPGAYAFGMDRTEQERLQLQVQQSARMESVGRMAAGLAHDLNNILTAIGGYASLAAVDAVPGSDSEEELAGIQTEVDRASLLVKKLLSISRMRSPERTSRRIELAAHISNIEGTMKHLVPSRIQLVVEPTDGEAWVDVEVGEMEQALLNLVANSVDAIDGNGCVTVSTERRAGEVAISVRDTGTGIPESVLPRIFEPFFTTKDEGHGTGLGLASANAFARRSGGRIEVATSDGAGSTISIVLPLARVAVA